MPELLTFHEIVSNPRTSWFPLWWWLSDVAKVTWDTWPMVGDAIIDDELGLMMIVEKLPWANTLDVTHGIEGALADLAPGLPDITIDSAIFRPATFIEQSIGNRG